ncbi:MAG: hypothetical protein LBK46_03320 [Oscillospiraceae bacterium]|jgi:hypothetical protein|nr:hypothetical protein [Oscillospiraceae bacterium]
MQGNGSAQREAGADLQNPEGILTNTLDDRCVLYVSSCDAYSDLWEPFFTLLVKYWPDCPYRIVLASETRTFSFPGLDISCPRFFTMKQRVAWGELNSRTLSAIPSPFVLFMLEDFLLIKPVNQAFITKTLDWIEADPKACKFQWARNGIDPPNGSAQCAAGADLQNPEGILTNIDDAQMDLVYHPTPKTKAWRVNAQAAIWRRQSLIQSMLPTESAWTWENWGTKRSKHWKEQMYSSHVSPMTYPRSGALYHHVWQVEGVEALRDNGIEMNFNKRGVLEKTRYPVKEKEGEKVEESTC